ncbi:VanW family protein [Lysobacter fragariae]
MSAQPAAMEGALPTRRQAVVFAGKAWLLRVQRAVRDAVDAKRPRRHARGDVLGCAPVLAEFEAALWPREDSDAAFVAGKIHNLRVALRSLHGIEMPAGAVFGFWRHVGRATRRRGYVVGRELREGCLIPSVGGGLCLLSNAIHDCAVRAGLQVTERHRHSRVLPGSLAQHDRDATVFWNYIDLRLCAPFAWRLEVTMDARRLRVRIRGEHPRGAVAMPVALSARNGEADAVNDCHSCGQDECHRRVGPQPDATTRLWWLSSSWPEFDAYLASERVDGDRVIGAGGERLPLRTGWRRWREALLWRIARWRGDALPQVMYAQARREARLLAARLRPSDVHVVVPQHLLPFLWGDGHLAGRRFDVLMTALPMPMLQEQLDAAMTRHRGCHSLGDFRAPADLVDAESEALAAADAWLSPHVQVCAAAGAKAVRLPWVLPDVSAPRAPRGQRPRVFLASSPLARKGVFELLAALDEEDVEILLPPGDGEPVLEPGRASLRRVATYNQGLAQADVVVLPAWVEHQPRALLAAIAAGVPVVATGACGLPDDLAWRRVVAGDIHGLRDAILDGVAPPR